MQHSQQLFIFRLNNRFSLRFSSFRVPTEHCCRRPNIAFASPLAWCRQKHRSVSVLPLTICLILKVSKWPQKVAAVRNARIWITLSSSLNFLSGWPLKKGRGDPCRHQVPGKGTFRDNSCSRPGCQCDQFSNCVFPQDKMNIVSVKLESESDDLRSSEKEDVDLGEV